MPFPLVVLAVCTNLHHSGDAGPAGLGTTTPDVCTGLKEGPGRAMAPRRALAHRAQGLQQEA